MLSGSLRWLGVKSVVEKMWTTESRNSPLEDQHSLMDAITMRPEFTRVTEYSLIFIRSSHTADTARKDCIPATIFCGGFLNNNIKPFQLPVGLDNQQAVLSSSKKGKVLKLHLVMDFQCHSNLSSNFL